MNRESGSTLVIVMVVTAALSLTMIALLSETDAQSHSVRISEISNVGQILETEISNLLVDDTSCGNTFSGLSLDNIDSAGEFFLLNSIRNAANDIEYQLNGTYRNSIRLDGIQINNFVADPLAANERYSGWATLQIDYSGVGEDISTKPKQINVHFSFYRQVADGGTDAPAQDKLVASCSTKGINTDEADTMQCATGEAEYDTAGNIVSTSLVESTVVPAMAFNDLFTVSPAVIYQGARTHMGINCTDGFIAMGCTARFSLIPANFDRDLQLQSMNGCWVNHEEKFGAPTINVRCCRVQ